MYYNIFFILLGAINKLFYTLRLYIGIVKNLLYNRNRLKIAYKKKKVHHDHFMEYFEHVQCDMQLVVIAYWNVI